MSDLRHNNVKNLHEMVFVYNAVMDGWTVKKMKNGKIKLKKKTTNLPSRSRVTNEHYTSESEQTHTQQYELDLIEFVKENTSLERIFDV